MDMNAIASYLQTLRKEKNLTQAELGERLGVSAQSVSNWERAESLPDTALLPELAMIYGVSVDEILGGGSASWRYRRRVTVAQMWEAMTCIQRLSQLLGQDHFMYRTMIDALDKRMNSEIEPAFGNPVIWDAYVCETLIACARDGGDYVDIGDIQANIKSEKPREWTIRRLKELGFK